LPRTPEPEDLLAARLGATVRSRRRALGLTMQTVATRAGISQPFLSQIERGLARPSMRSLDQIAQSLDSSAPSLLAGDDDRADVVIMWATDPGARPAVRQLTGGARHLRAVELGGGSPELPERYVVHRNEELSVVLAGRFVFDVAGEQHELGPGDTIACSGGIPHRHRIVGEPPHRLLAVTVPDDFDVVRHDGQALPSACTAASSVSSDLDPLTTPHCAAAPPD
jgi:transcriptional regulator with XRE-family HTH domain